MNFKIGSLFDGSGGFPLAATMCGGTPVWASEIEPYPIAVTKSRFPNMKHLGSVTDVKGNEVEPVDVITFGSPCQDLSVAGKRAGLKHEDNGDEETTRSGLFMEAVRIIKEMREATNGLYPRFAIWENVPGAFSSNKGEDFRTVCEELIKIVEPGATMPAVPKNGWPYADCYCGEGWSLAYRVFDAQYWGVPQRRRRIYLVADFRGECAGQASFEREGLRGYFTESGTPWSRIATDVERGVGADDRDGAVPYTLKIRSGCEGAVREDGKAPTLRAEMHGNVPCVMDDAGFCTEHSAKSRSIGFEEETAPTLRAGVVPACVFSVENHPADSRVDIDESGTVQTLTSRMGTGGGNVPMVMEPICINERQYALTCTEGKANTLTGTDYKGVQLIAIPEQVDAIYCLDGDKIGKAERSGGAGLGIRPGDKMYTLTAKDAGTHAVCVHYIVRRLTPTECARLQGFTDRWAVPDSKEDLTDEEYRFWLTVRNTHAEINGKAVKDYTKAQMLTWYNKLYTDSSEYKLWGNGISLPTALYVMQGIADVLIQ